MVLRPRVDECRAMTSVVFAAAHCWFCTLDGPTRVEMRTRLPVSEQRCGGSRLGERSGHP